MAPMEPKAWTAAPGRQQYQPSSQLPGYGPIFLRRRAVCHAEKPCLPRSTGKNGQNWNLPVAGNSTLPTGPAPPHWVQPEFG